MPRVSVLMPCYNEERNIVRSVTSVLNQTYEDFELVIVDDGSTDGTVDLVRSINDARIRIIEKNQNSGVADSLNVGIDRCSGVFIARMDADDECSPHRLRRQLECFREDSGLVLVGSWGLLRNRTSQCVVEKRPPVDDIGIRRMLQKDNIIIHSSVMVRTSALKSVGGYSRIQGFEDYDLWLRLSEHGRFRNIPEFLVLRYEDNNLKTRKAWEGMARRRVYLTRLRYQMEAVRRFGPHFLTPFYIGKTLVSIALCRE